MNPRMQRLLTQVMSRGGSLAATARRRPELRQGRDEKGITAMLKSLSKRPHDRAAGSSAAIVEIVPKHER